MNLLSETKAILEENGKSFFDLKHIGTDKIRISIDNFIEIADTEYDSGFGAQEVASDLIIIGDDFWMVRGEYDGSEGWEYRKMPDIPDIPDMEKKRIECLTVNQAKNCSCGWETVASLNGIDD